mmetsp:Transcript_15886/g.24464  ORF Transcript_15886/g.24464 Transcript_15886/m.24464 type:complete len:128 (+) Transcript_15886:913-1296(+)|eukprot:CAMPEP_0170493204 /NCGR_PEP_ID=MMETSP0208-20121228/13518_1 /TAXON_ID=197538 /ORGANISM="Strombidium inclinatum, Strain S3" /LENGTH=127 /DNA_ID=CAMNT_0010769097 /DNA_START=879 /DNA_END=1262 /DNA_ORIENTATION=-
MHLFKLDVADSLAVVREETQLSSESHSGHTFSGSDKVQNTKSMIGMLAQSLGYREFGKVKGYDSKVSEYSFAQMKIPLKQASGIQDIDSTRTQYKLNLKEFFSPQGLNGVHMTALQLVESSSSKIGV